MRLQKKLPIWLTGVAIGVSGVALPATTALAQKANGNDKLTKVDKDAVPQAVKDAFKASVKGVEEVNYFSVVEGGTTYYVARGNKGDKRQQQVFAADGTAVTQPGAVEDPTAALAQAGASREMTALQQQVQALRSTNDQERAEEQREAQRAGEVREQWNAGKIQGAQLATLEQQGAERERQANGRAQEAATQAEQWRAKAAAATNAQVKEQYNRLVALAEERQRINLQTARHATATQNALDQAELAGDAQPASGNISRKKLGFEDVPKNVRQAFGTHTDGSTNQSFYQTTSGGTKYYTVQYTKGGQQYFVRANENGQVVRGPVAMTEGARQAAGTVAGTGGGAAGLDDDVSPSKGATQVSGLNDVPAAARATFQKQLDDKAQNATYFKKTADGKTVYHSVSHPGGDKSKNRHIFVDESGKVVRDYTKDNPNYKGK